jgi:surfeit locus 1 family protein
MGKTGMASTYLAIIGLLALAALFATLGSWQLRRAETSRATLEQFASAAAGDALAALPSRLDEALRFRRIEVDGEYVGAPQFLLDNMLHDGVAGYHVLTAMRVRDRRERVLVNRGWVPAGDRRVLPDVGVDSSPQRVTGRLQRLPRPALRLGDEDANESSAGPAIVLQYPTAAELALRLGEPLLDYQLLLDAGEPQGYVRDWRAPGTAPERHLSYAGQWLALAAGAFAAAIVWTVRMARRTREA